MLSNETPARIYKNTAYGAVSEVGKALASPRRLELLDLLLQRPHTVEDLAGQVGLAVASTSQHLQVLRRAHLVETRREGTFVEYRPAPGVAEVVVALRRLAAARSPELAQATRRFHGEARLDRAALEAGLADGSLLLLDVRPADEFAAGHLPGARSLPVGSLAEHLADLPRDRRLVVYCRGPFCAFAGDAVRLLRAQGFDAVRFEDGVAEWTADGGRVVQ